MHTPNADASCEFSCGADVNTLASIRAPPISVNVPFFQLPPAEPAPIHSPPLGFGTFSDREKLLGDPFVMAESDGWVNVPSRLAASDWLKPENSDCR